MPSETKTKSLRFLYIIIILVIVVVCVFGLFFNGFLSPTSEYYDQCRQINKQFGSPPVDDCVIYLENNPKATIHDVIDHFSVQVLDGVLIKPIVVPDS